MKLFATTLYAAALAGSAALADVAPEPPIDPIPESCKPLIGVWQRTTPEITRWMTTWTFLVVDSRLATKLYYMDEGKGVNVQAQTAIFHITCTPGANGTLTIDLSSASDEEGGSSMDITLAGDSFTTTDQTVYDQPGAPDPNWKPETYSVTYKRIAN
jgi:hypothetical protein